MTGRGLSVRVGSRAGEPVTLPLGARPVYVGRAATNDVVLDDEQVSARHCALSATGGRAYVEDLASRNGTWLGDRRVRRREAWPEGVPLRVAGWTLELLPGDLAAAPLLALREPASGLLVPIRDRLRIGGPRADVGEGTDEEWTLLVDPDGQAWLGSADGSLEPVALGQELALGARRWELTAAPPDAPGATADAAVQPWPYSLRVRMGGPTGPEAVVTSGSDTARFEAENRVVVWYLLGRRFTHDRAAGLAAAEVGWIDEQEVATGVWGRDGSVANLGVLLTRIRHDLRRSNLDPWFLERRRGHLRARVADVEVVE